jgi:glycosyltransferase involved in cell wall biosynthesis
MTAERGISFVSSHTASPWGGCEELWSRAAMDLISQGVPVSASVRSWSQPHQRILELAEVGVHLYYRPTGYSLQKRLWRRMTAGKKGWTAIEFEKFLAAEAPALVVFSESAALPAIDLLQLCISKRLPFVTISHTSSPDWWPDDELADRYREVMPMAQRCYFVSKAIQRLVEKQLGQAFPNAEIICNPFNVDRNVSLPWPPLNGSIRLACVATLHPPSKGQDILLEALADPVWRHRNWRLTFYGEGPMRDRLNRMVHRFALQDRVGFAGFVEDVEKIWAENHVLVMSSRYEGLPLTIVEAMLCARPIVATDVGGNSEIVEDGVTGFLAESATVSSMTKALERLWNKRTDLEEIGKAAAKSIREHVPADPVRVFSGKLKSLIHVP